MFDKIQLLQKGFSRANPRVKLLIPAQNAVGGALLNPILGQYGLNIKLFCDQFNDQTKDILEGFPVNVVLIVLDNKMFSFEIKGPLLMHLVNLVVFFDKDDLKCITGRDFFMLVKIKKLYSQLSAVSIAKNIKSILVKNKIKIKK